MTASLSQQRPPPRSKIVLQCVLYMIMSVISHGWIPLQTVQFMNDPSISQRSRLRFGLPPRRHSRVGTSMARSSHGSSSSSSSSGSNKSSFQPKRRKSDASAIPKGNTGSFQSKKTSKHEGPSAASSTASSSSSSLVTPRSSRPSPTSSSSSSLSVQLPNQKPRAPPWQVLSSKDIKANVQKEKQRRELAQKQQQADANAVTTNLTDEEDDDVASVSTEFLSEADRSLLRWKPFNPSTVPRGMQYLGSYLGRQLPPRLGVPEIAFLGRSNVGKSSLLNRLAAMTSSSSSSSTSSSNTKSTGSSTKSYSSSTATPRNDQARVGKTPGATAAVNLYAMLGSRSLLKQPKPILGLVDLPGFGYAKLSKQVQESVQEAAERYLQKRKELALGILLVDVRRDEPSDDDRAVLTALYDMGVPIVVVATKIDKLSSQYELEKNLQGIRHGLGLPDEQSLLCVSSVTGQGVKELWRIVLEACEDHIHELKAKLTNSESAANEGDDDNGSYDFLEDDDADDMDANMYDRQGNIWIQSAAEESHLIDANDETIRRQDPESIHSLKKRARDLERNGEI